MHPDQIATFLDLAETASFHRSAERLGLTQSTVSARIAALEAALGTRLFSRSRAGAQLTTEGLKFAPHARALRHAWAEAQRSVTPTGESALNLRIGIQSDLAAHGLGDWAQGFRRALPDVALYIEPDYSAQMCRDISEGRLDFAVLYTPHPAPDLHFTTLGEARYILVSTVPARLADLAPARLIRANYAPAFAAAQAAAIPAMAEAAVASGQSAAVASLLLAMGGAAYVLEDTARAMGAAVSPVADAPAIGQPVQAATHLRHRTSPMHRTLLRIMRQHFARPRG
ncbi:MAG: LysR family transcriptional regulator [Paracoccaceae bacterium]|nr:MAG: LysR family transcriptional regulator [Paracoccaceae bacterium]